MQWHAMAPWGNIWYCVPYDMIWYKHYYFDNDHEVSLLAPGTKISLVPNCVPTESTQAGTWVRLARPAQRWALFFPTSSDRRADFKYLKKCIKVHASFMSLRQSSPRRRASTPPMLLQQHRCRTLWTRFGCQSIMRGTCDWSLPWL